jgi:hypothetical protein
MTREKTLMPTAQALAARRAREKMSPEQLEMERLRNRLRKYGLTVFAARELERAQGGTCAICADAISLSDRRSHIDHDHETGKVRGILCAPCNQAIAYFDRMIGNEKKIREYLGEEA